MFQGTGSDVGKSLLVAGLCRVFARRGVKVAPFKAQNMSNNAGVTGDKGEIGRAQILQAIAAGIEPSIHMNPVLLKPQSDKTSQVIVRGKLLATMGAAEYQKYRAKLLPVVLKSYHKLAQNADLILVEGAGSPAEINLRESDIANMGFSRAAGVPVVLIGDIERGGVIASLVGTHAVLPDADRAMIKGFMVNKFRGDAGLFASGAAEIVQRTGWQDLGLIPHFSELAKLPQEDSLALSSVIRHPSSGDIHIAILKTPHIANFDDIDPLANAPNVRVSWVSAGEVIPANADLVILAGSKSTIADLEFIKTQGWDIDLQAHVRRGGRVLGICGGYQMLGKTISDPHGIEGQQGTVAGLGLLDVDTVFSPEKTVSKWSGSFQSIAVQGYEIHLGATTGEDASRPLFYTCHPHEGGDLNPLTNKIPAYAGMTTPLGKPEGAISKCWKIWGTYIHGAFANDDFRRVFLSPQVACNDEYGYNYHQQIDEILNRWADILEESISIEQLLQLAE